MKLLITAALCFFSLACFCQVRSESKKAQEVDTSDFQNRLIRQMASENPLLANRQGSIAFLPQDRMPCLLPDSAAMRPIPNAWPAVEVPYKPLYHAIPNPSGHVWSFQYNVLTDGALPSKK